MCLRLPYHQCACVEILSNISKLTLLPDVIHLGLVQLLSINYMEKLGDSSTVDALDGNLKDFKPPGTFFCLVMESPYFSQSRTRSKLRLLPRRDTPGRRESHRETQLCILPYVEGGSYTREEDQWEFAVLCVVFYFWCASCSWLYSRYKKRGQRDEILHITSPVIVLVLTFTIS